MASGALSLSATIAGTTQFVYNAEEETTATIDIMCKRAQQQQSSRPPCAIVAVIDVSGSMYYSLELVKDTLQFMIQNLTPADSFAMVTFGSDVKVDLPLTLMTPANYERAKNIIRQVQIRGLTFLSGGLLKGLDIILKGKCSNASLMLLTDGYATEGLTSEVDIVNAVCPIAQEINKKCSLSIHTFGYYENHSHRLLRGIAEKNKGMYYFVKEQKSIAGAFAECLGGIVSAVAKNVVLEVQGMNGVTLKNIVTSFQMKRKSAYIAELNLDDIDDDEKRNIPITFKLPKASRPSNGVEALKVTATYMLVEENALKTTTTFIKVDRILPKSEGGKGPEITEEQKAKAREVDEHCNRLAVAEALEQATMLGTSSNFTTARSVLQETKQKLLKSISANSTFTKQLVSDLDAALEAISSTSAFNGQGAKYMYSLARSHYTQRSSGISTSSAAAYLTEAKKQMIRAATGEAPTTPAPTPAPASSSSSSSSSNTVKLVTAATPAEPQRKEAKSVAVVAPKVVVPAADKIKAIRRLMRDLIEVEATPLSSVVARPLESDVFEWHCCLRAPEGNPYSGIVFHIILNFPETYPAKPPTLYFCSDISHKHVFRSWVCLDLLEEHFNSSDINTPYTGWSSAYSVQTILLQLQSFLFDEAETSPAAISKARASAVNFKCATCTHTHSNNWPSFPAATTTQKLASPVRTIKIVSSRPVQVVKPTALVKPKPGPAPVVPAVNQWATPLQLKVAPPALKAAPAPVKKAAPAKPANKQAQKPTPPAPAPAPAPTPVRVEKKKASPGGWITIEKKKKPTLVLLK